MQVDVPGEAGEEYQSSRQDDGLRAGFWRVRALGSAARNPSYDCVSGDGGFAGYKPGGIRIYEGTNNSNGQTPEGIG